MTRGSAIPDLPRPLVYSFLKETKGLVSWTVRDLANSIRVSQSEAKQVLPILELQGYVQQTGANGQYITTQSGEIVSGAKFPRFKRDSIERALKDLTDKIRGINRDSRSLYRISKAVAFGDFLGDRPQTQAADVGIKLELRKGAPQNRNDERAFLRSLRPKGTLVHLEPFEPWMERRLHRSLC